MGIAIYYILAVILMAMVVYMTIYYKKKCTRKCSTVPTNWPIFGMLPGIIHNVGRIHDFITDILEELGGTFEFKGPWFADMDMLFTSDPNNINHILTKNFENYPKGPKFQEIFDDLGDGIFNADSELWKLHRRTISAIMNHSQFHSSLEKSVLQKMENGLFPVLDYYSENGEYFDLQEILQRFTFDSIVVLLLDEDPATLSMNFPRKSLQQGFHDATEATLYRYLLPKCLWKSQKWVGVDREKKLAQGRVILDKYLYSIFQEKLQDMKDDEVKSKNDEVEEDCDKFCVFTSYTKVPYQGLVSSSLMHFLRDTFTNLIFAGRDTTSTCLTWLFWLLARNPPAEAKIRDEIAKEKPFDDKFLKVEECRNLVYLHAALCESLRLFPPVPLNHKAPMKMDELPSGHGVRPNTRVILSFYSVGRMRSVWGDDCMEFKPERWISEKGKINHVPSYKFPVFNAGPKSCIGKNMSFIVMKMVAATIIHHYHFQLMEAHPVLPRNSVILHAKHGLKVKLIKKSI